VRILIVEDDRKMADILKRGLEEETHAVTLAHTGPDGLAAAQSSGFDAIVLDVMLPGLDGFRIAQRLRAAHNQTPILMLTARDSVPDLVHGLDIGADDYLTKPFSFEVLLARLRALARRGAPAKPAPIRFADLTLDPASHEVRRGSTPAPLTRTEYNILELLMRNAGRVVTRDKLIEAVWGFDREIENNTLDAFMSLLRAKIDSGSAKKLIHTVRGVGYSLRDGDSR
jgi:DNA-binding response OmpR family regulator